MKSAPPKSAARIVSGQGGDELLPAKQHRIVTAAVDRRAEQGDIDQVREQRVALNGTGSFLELDANIGKFSCDTVENQRNVHEGSRRGKAQADHPRFTTGHSPRPIGGAVRQGQDPLGLRQEAPAGGRQPHRSVGALEQLDLERPFERLHLAAQRGLGHVQSGGRPAEVHLFRGGDETGQLGEIEHAGSSLSGMIGRGLAVSWRP